MRHQFAQRYGSEAAERARVVAAPGRVNLIGEHTDYNEGFVFPIAINYSIRLMGAPRHDGLVRAYSMEMSEAVEFDLERIDPDQIHPWSNYLRGVLSILQEAGCRLRGLDILVTGNIPQGAGLSSSAAFEVATALLARELYGLDMPDLDLIRLCQRAENLFVGVNCGILDQFASKMGRKGHALLLDCRDLSYRYYPLDPARASVVLINSGVKHSLVSSEYNIRRQQCEDGAEELRRHDPAVHSLRDATPALLERYSAGMEPVIARRCRHVVEEDARTLEAAEALTRGDLARFGLLMYESHASLRDLYEVSCEELDILVDLARERPGVFGSRMTGGGFGGCTVNLVEPSRVDEFAAGMAASYEQRTGRRPEIYVCSADEGAGVVLQDDGE